MTLYYVCVALAVALSIGMLWATRYGKEQIRRVPLYAMAIACIPLAFVCARLCYCLFRYDYYFLELGPLSLLNIKDGGFMLYGAVLGATLGAVIAAWAYNASIPLTLDELVIPGLSCIALCRLAEGFAHKGLGPWVENPLWHSFPFATTNAYGEWQLSVFLWEAIAALIVLFIARSVMHKPFPRSLPGEGFLTALLLYACFQIVFESLRTDAVVRIGFVRVSQVISAVVVLTVTLIRAIRYGGGKWHVIGYAVLIVLLVTGVGIIEWALDKTVLSNVFLYVLMSILCLAMALAGTHARRHTQWTIGAIKAKKRA